MASSDPSAKRGQREEDDDESSCRQRKYLTIKEKGKELAPKEKEKKEADEELFPVNDTKFAVTLLMGAFMKLQDVAEAFKINGPYESCKDESIKGLTYRIHGLAEKLEKLPVVQRERFLLPDKGGPDGDDDGDDVGSNDDDSGSTPTAARSTD